MSLQATFDELWGEGGPASREPDLCPFAESFKQWIVPHLQEVLTAPTHICINETMVLITKKYREWRNVVPKQHRNRIGDTGHICIFHVWDEGCRALEAAELSLTPPQLYLPEPVRAVRRKKEPPAPAPEPELWGGGILGLKVIP